MARISGRDAIKDYVKKYGGKGVDYFTLTDDGDEAKVRFMHTDDQDLEIYLVHKVEIDGKEKWVECLEEGCPLCEKLGPPTIKVFIYLFDYKDEKIKVWERGNTIIDYLLGYVDKCGPLNNRDYTIVRHGKKNDNKTSYQLFQEDKGPAQKLKDPKNPEAGYVDVDIGERPKTIGRFVLSMTKDELEDLLAENEPQARDEKKGKGKTARF